MEEQELEKLNALQAEVREHFRNQQQKYVYYLIALSVSAIGFSLYNTMNLSLAYSQIPLGISILCWGGSAHCGLSFLKYGLSILQSNHQIFTVQKGEHPQVLIYPSYIKAAVDGITQAIDSNIQTASRLFRWQEYLLYVGVISFVIWRVTEMYLSVNGC